MDLTDTWAPSQAVTMEGPSPLQEHPDIPREVQLSTTCCHPCRYWVSSTRTAFPVQLHTSSMENGCFYLSRWQLCKASPSSLWHIFGRSVFPIIQPGDNFLSIRKGHEAQYPLQRETLDPLLNIIIFSCTNPERLSTTPHPWQRLLHSHRSQFTRSQDSTTGALWRGVMVAHRSNLHLRCHYSESLAMFISRFC